MTVPQLWQWVSGFSYRFNLRWKISYWVLLTVMALPCSLWFFSLCKALYASCRRFIQINAQPLGGIKSMDTMSPYSPKVSDSSSWCTNFDRCPTQRVVLHTGCDTQLTHINPLYALYQPNMLRVAATKLPQLNKWHNMSRVQRKAWAFCCGLRYCGLFWATAFTTAQQTRHFQKVVLVK
jgi:hypothetical protein